MEKKEKKKEIFFFLNLTTTTTKYANISRNFSGAVAVIVGSVPILDSSFFQLTLLNTYRPLPV